MHVHPPDFEPVSSRHKSRSRDLEKNFRDVGLRVELCIIDLLETGRGWGRDGGRSIQLESPPADDHRLIFIQNGGVLSGSVAGLRCSVIWKEETRLY
jgi:hypothetical protein